MTLLARMCMTLATTCNYFTTQLLTFAVYYVASWLYCASILASLNIVLTRRSGVSERLTVSLSMSGDPQAETMLECDQLHYHERHSAEQVETRDARQECCHLHAQH